MKEDQKSQQSDSKHENIWCRANRLRNRFPIVFNVILMGIAGLLVLWIILVYLDHLTNHGQEQVVPDVKNQNIHIATGNLEKEGFKVELADSIFDSTLMPGTVVEQNPHPGSMVKPGRSVYLTIVAYTPKMVTVPDIVNTSLRQGESMLQGVGFKTIIVKRVPSEYQDLVLDATCNGKTLRPGQKLPVNSVIILEVGEGLGEDGELLGDSLFTEADYSPVVND